MVNVKKSVNIVHLMPISSGQGWVPRHVFFNKESILWCIQDWRCWPTIVTKYGMWNNSCILRLTEKSMHHIRRYLVDLGDKSSRMRIFSSPTPAPSSCSSGWAWGTPWTCVNTRASRRNAANCHSRNGWGCWKSYGVEREPRASWCLHKASPRLGEVRPRSHHIPG